MIDLKTLRSLVKLMTDNELSELDISDKDEQVHLKRAGGHVQPVALPPAVAPAPAPVASAPAGAPTPAAETPAADENAGLVEITSPMVGTFYSSPSPDADAFVGIGDKVNDSTVVCIVEAMKVFNEIQAETSGTIQKVLVSDGQAVEYGQALYLVKPE